MSIELSLTTVHAFWDEMEKIALFREAAGKTARFLKRVSGAATKRAPVAEGGTPVAVLPWQKLKPIELGEKQRLDQKAREAQEYVRSMQKPRLEAQNVVVRRGDWGAAGAQAHRGVQAQREFQHVSAAASERAKLEAALRAKGADVKELGKLRWQEGPGGWQTGKWTGSHMEAAHKAGLGKHSSVLMKLAAMGFKLPVPKLGQPLLKSFQGANTPLTALRMKPNSLTTVAR